MAVGHAVFPLPYIISGTFPDESRCILITNQFFFLRRGRICLLQDIGGESEFEENAFKLRLLLIVFPTLLMLFTWHFNAKVFNSGVYTLTHNPNMTFQMYYCTNVFNL